MIRKKYTNKIEFSLLDYFIYIFNSVCLRTIIILDIVLVFHLPLGRVVVVVVSTLFPLPPPPPPPLLLRPRIKKSFM
jgi:hypothetical protein